MIRSPETAEAIHPDQADTRWRQVLKIECNACGKYVEPISLGGPAFMCTADDSAAFPKGHRRKVAPTEGAIECSVCFRWATFVLERLPVTQEANDRAVKHVACRTCGARPGSACFTRSSNVDRPTPHIARVTFEWLHR